MNRVVTSREELLHEAKKIVFEEGADKLSIRCLAKRCGIATGSVYNYFPSKAELLFAVVEEFWKTVFHNKVCDTAQIESFTDFFESVWLRLCEYMNEFRRIFLGQFQMMGNEERKKGKKVEETYLNHVWEAFLTALGQDEKIHSQIWGSVFTKERFVDFLFSNMFFMLSSGEKDCGFLKETISRLLYY